MPRGRPAYRDVLTPREWEVLALVREGLTNEQIASQLGISERGARYHVSEILSKLGVESREEAAAWVPPSQRRLSMFSPLPSFGGLKQIASLITGLNKPAVAMLLPTVMLSLVAGGYGIAKVLEGGDARAPGIVVQAGAAPNPCAGLFTYQCLPAESQDYNTLQDAVAAASFQPALPKYVPDGFAPVVIRHTRPDGTSDFIRSESFKQGCPGCDPRFSHNDQIGVYYRGPGGRQLAVVQGFPASLPLYDSAPEDQRGTIRIGDREAFWVQGLPGGALEGQIVIYLEVGRVGSG